MSDRSVLVKICGVRTLEAAQAAVDAGADLLGFICYPPARRYLPPEQIAAILESLRHRSSVRAVGVFVNQPLEAMNTVAVACGLDLIQLSGGEEDDVLPLLNRPVMKVWRLAGRGQGGHGGPPLPVPSVTIAASSPPPGLGEGLGRRPAVRTNLFATLLEPAAAGWGGAGRSWDWSAARSITDLPSRPPVFLAGGLDPENIAGAIAAVRPDGVDVSSGVEVEGVQVGARIAAFVAAAKGATA
ncbi:MAG TPA: phosphoribosylanthranilate isomerase [Chloroflexota bacterium]|nr:phosphoribosylanthranilate isomerase [Chloroflexota bacterium]